MERLMYLKPNVVIEPLIDHWYAWSHLVSPATRAMNLAERHMNIFESFLMAPELHAEAVKNPKMLGGPFMDIAIDRRDDVKKLMDDTAEKRNDLMAFAKAVGQLDQLLRTEANGDSLEGIYQKIPEILKGYVELFYDRANNPGFRFYEQLLYNSKYYAKDAQGIALWISDNDHRPFALSTPRLAEDHVLYFAIPFDDELIDELARMKRSPKPLSFIFDRLPLPLSLRQTELLKSFFTETPPRPYQEYKGDKIRMRYFGHACILIETAETSVLVDPLISYYGYQSTVSHFSDIDLPYEIDYVLITHNHQDHILFETLLPMRHRIKNIVVPRSNGGRLEDPDLKLMLQHMGFKNVIAVDEMETIAFKDIKLTSIPFIGEHSDLNILSKSCYLLHIDKFNLMYLADSNVIDIALYRHIHAQIGDVDVLFLGMECDGAPLSWLYGPLFTTKISRNNDNSRRLSGSDSLKGLGLVDIFNPREVYVYAMGQEPWLEFISSIRYTDESNPIIQSNNLVKACQAKGIVAERLYGEKELFYEKHKS